MWWIFGIPILVIILFVLFMFWATKRGEQQVKLALERLAAIDQSRVIPDEKNAAQIYDDIQAHYSFSVDMNDTEVVSEIYAKLKKLLDYEQCYYPIPSYSDLDYMSHISAMRKSALFLREMAFIDLAEGTLAAAFEKLSCLKQISRHIQQQPDTIDFLVRIAVDGIAVRFLSCIIMQTTVTEENLDMAAALSGQLEDEWAEVTELTFEVDRLQDVIYRKELRQWQWHPSNWRYSISIFFSGDYNIEENIKLQYLFLIAGRRTLHILTELRRYYNENGQWPETLEEIKSTVPELAWVDPYTKASFIYKKEGDGFRLYSKGPNGTDENGSHDGPADDQLFWPPSGTYKEKLPIQKTLGIESTTQEN